MFKFRKYPSITNSYLNSTIDHIISHGYDKEEWCALLKVHGANVSIWVDNDHNIKIAKRTSFLDNNKKCAWESTVNTTIDNIKNDIINAFEDLKTIYDDVKEITFYGEFAGGNYPHKDVKKSNHAKKVQNGVFYAPFNFFYLFDIKVDGRFIDHDTVIDIAHKNNLIVAEYLYKGDFNKCLEYSNKFEDPLHKMFGLPSMGEDNVCEGIVLKPIKPCFFENGKRCILKNKNDKFKENCGVRKNKIKKVYEWSPEGKELLEVASTFINENRLRNVLSHGDVDVSDIKKAFNNIMKSFNIDINNDFMKEYGDKFKCLELIEQKLIKKNINIIVAGIIRTNWKDILNGEF